MRSDIRIYSVTVRKDSIQKKPSEQHQHISPQYWFLVSELFSEIRMQALPEN